MDIKIPAIVAQLGREIFSVAPNHIESFLVEMMFPDATATMPSVISKAVTSEHPDDESVIAVIPVSGLLLPESSDRHGVFGYDQMTNALNAAIANPAAKAIVHHVKSPGGSVSGLAEYADALYNCPKPTYAFIDGIGASAAYYIAAASDHIMATKRSSVVGNIGTKIMTLDMSGILENFGAKKIEVYGTLATKKDLGFTAAKKGDYTLIKEILVDPMNQMFVDDVKRYRPPVPDSALNGIIYYSEAALQNNLVDSLGTFQDLLNKINSDLNQKNKPMSKDKKVLMLIPSAVVGMAKLAGAETPEEGTEAAASAKVLDLTASLESEQAKTTALTSEIADLKAAAATLAAAENPLTAKVTELEASLTAEQDKTAALTAEVEAFKAANPAAARTTSRAEGTDPVPVATTAKEEIVLTMASEYEDELP